MTIRQCRTIFTDALIALYDADEALSIFYRWVQSRLGISRVQISINPEKALNADEVAVFETDLTRLKSGEPIQYVLGEASFYGLEFIVTPAVLIPRPETEELVDWIVKSNPAGEILDVCTGSGCIAVSLAKALSRRVTAIDILAEALEIARQNASANQANVNFIQADALNLPPCETRYDVIVSNPPYVRHSEKSEIKPHVLDHEPHLALFVPNDDALIFYRAIGQWAKTQLTPKGKLYFEINQYLGEQTVNLMLELGFLQVELKKDLAGNDRMICCYS